MSQSEEFKEMLKSSNQDQIENFLDIMLEDEKDDEELPNLECSSSTKKNKSMTQEESLEKSAVDILEDNDVVHELDDVKTGFLKT